MKLTPTPNGKMQLNAIYRRMHPKSFLASETILVKNDRSFNTKNLDGKDKEVKASAVSPFRAKSWQNKIWSKYYKGRDVSADLGFYETADHRKIESVVFKYFVIRRAFDYDTGETISRKKVLNECVYCPTFNEITRQLIEIFHAIDRLNRMVEEDEEVATYTATFRALVRYADGTYDSTPTYLHDVFDILGVKPSYNQRQYRVFLNPDVKWTPMQNVIRGEYK